MNVNHWRGLVTFLLLASAILMLGSTSLRSVHAQTVTLDQSYNESSSAGFMRGCNSGAYCETSAAISSNANRYILVFLNMISEGGGFGTFSAICLAVSGSTCESGNYVTLTREVTQVDGQVYGITQLIFADAYTTTGFTNYMLRYEYSTVGDQTAEFGFDISTWANTATTSPFFQNLCYANELVNTGGSQITQRCTVASGTTGRMAVAGYTYSSNSPYCPNVSFYETEVSNACHPGYPTPAYYGIDHGVEDDQTSGSVTMEVLLSNNVASLGTAMISLAILPLQRAMRATTMRLPNPTNTLQPRPRHR